MKIMCDLCGSQLQMNADGQGAVCVNCGMTYTLDRLREKLNANKPKEDIPSAQGNQTMYSSPKTADDDVIYEAAWKVVDSDPKVYIPLHRANIPYREKVLTVWRHYLPQVKPQYSATMVLHDKMKNCYFSPEIPADCAQRASRYLTKGKIAPQDILGHYSTKPQGGLAGIVVSEDRIFLPTGLGIEYTEIFYADILRAEVKKDGSRKMKTTLSLLSTSEITLYYKDNSIKHLTVNANYRPEPIVQALNELIS